MLHKLFLSRFHASGQGVRELKLTPWALNDPTVATLLLRARSLTSLDVSGKGELDARALGQAILRRASAGGGAGPSPSPSPSSFSRGAVGTASAADKLQTPTDPTSANSATLATSAIAGTTSGLTALDLSRGMRDVPSVLQTAAVALRASLRHLSLRRCPGLSTGGLRIVAVGGFVALQSLDLSGNPGVRDVTLLEIAVGCPNLELLNCNK